MLLSSTAGIAAQNLKPEQRGRLRLSRSGAAHNRKQFLSALFTRHVQLQPLKPALDHNRRRMQVSTTATAYSSSHKESSDHSGLKTYKIVVVPESTSVETFLTQVQNGRIDLQPEYQRDFEWQQPACSKFIETVLLQVPFQEVWLHEQPDRTRNVVDGQQRLTTLRAFKDTRLPNGQVFKLQGLEHLEQLNDMTYNDLPLDAQQIFLGSLISMRIVQSDASEDGLFELYTWMNTGSKNHSKQQNRRAIFRGSYIRMLDKLAKAHMGQLKDPKAPFRQEEDREYILRFFAFCNNLTNFKPPLHTFLNNEIRSNRQMKEGEVKRYEDRFNKTISMAINVFGPDVFKRYNGSKYQGGFDTTLWDTVMLTLERYDRADLQPKADALRAELEHLKGKSSFVPKAGENLSRRGIEARIGVFKNSIDAVIGMQRHADQNRLFSREIKERLFHANPQCSVCGQQILRLGDADVDHKIPFSEGGKTEPSNAQLLHSSCNRQKSNKMPVDISAARSHHQSNVNGNGVRYN